MTTKAQRESAMHSNETYRRFAQRLGYGASTASGWQANGAPLHVDVTITTILRLEDECENLDLRLTSALSSPFRAMPARVTVR